MTSRSSSWLVGGGRNSLRVWPLVRRSPMRVNLSGQERPGGARDLSPGWSEAEPWVCAIDGAALKERKRPKGLEPDIYHLGARTDSSALSERRAYMGPDPGFRFAPPWAKVSCPSGALLSAKVDAYRRPPERYRRSLRFLESKLSSEAGWETAGNNVSRLALGVFRSRRCRRSRRSWRFLERWMVAILIVLGLSLERPILAEEVPEPSLENADKSAQDDKDKNVIESNELGRIELDQKQTERAQFGVEVAGPAKIRASVPLYGKIAMNEDTVANVSPRFPGVVKAVSVRLGDRVQKGDVLAIVESNDSLKDYQVISAISGTIIKKDVTVGEAIRDDKLIFTVADLSAVWVDFSVFPQDFDRVRQGQTVRIIYAANVKPIAGRITYIAPIGSENTQSLLARAVAPNSAGLLRPGLFVTGELETDEVEVPIAVRPSAIQTLNEKTVVFVPEGNAFEAREVKLGARDNNLVQVLSGLNAGDRYVSVNSFLLKAELGKSQIGDQD
jgi:membrane fusion protein, heavy metal efflux system